MSETSDKIRQKIFIENGFLSSWLVPSRMGIKRKICDASEPVQYNIEDDNKIMLYHCKDDPVNKPVVSVKRQKQN